MIELAMKRVQMQEINLESEDFRGILKYRSPSEFYSCEPAQHNFITPWNLEYDAQDMNVTSVSSLAFAFSGLIDNCRHNHISKQCYLLVCSLVASPRMENKIWFLIRGKKT